MGIGRRGIGRRYVSMLNIYWGGRRRRLGFSLERLVIVSAALVPPRLGGILSTHVLRP